MSTNKTEQSENAREAYERSKNKKLVEEASKSKFGNKMLGSELKVLSIGKDRQQIVTAFDAWAKQFHGVSQYIKGGNHDAAAGYILAIALSMIVNQFHGLDDEGLRRATERNEAMQHTDIKVFIGATKKVLEDNPWPKRQFSNGSADIDKVRAQAVEQQKEVVKIAQMLAAVVRSHSQVAGFLDQELASESYARKLISGDYAAVAHKRHLRREEEDGTSLLVFLAETMNDVGMSGQLPRAGAKEDAIRLAHQSVKSVLAKAKPQAKHGLDIQQVDAVADSFAHCSKLGV